MGDAYSAGLRVSDAAVVRNARRLPLRGQVHVAVGDEIAPDDVVAGTDLPGKVFPVNLANRLGCMPSDVGRFMFAGEGGRVTKGEAMARTNGILGFFKTEVPSPVTGIIESISKRTGQIILAEDPIPIEVRAHLRGRVVEVFEDEGCLVETYGTLVQGIFCFGGEVTGVVHVLTDDPTQAVTPDLIRSEMAGRVAVGGGRLTREAFQAASDAGVTALVVGGVDYSDIKDILGYEVGVAITGHEDVVTTLVVTEGFGDIAMAQRTHALLCAAAGRSASVSGATQIRAGVIRPEVVVPTDDARPPAGRSDEAEGAGLEIGSLVRGIRVPHFGRIGEVVGLPVELAEMASGTRVRVLEAKWEDGASAVVPRANVEVIEQA